MGHIQISRPHYPGAVNIEKLMVDDVLAQKLLSRASLEVLQIHSSRSKLDRPSPDVRHVGDMDERTTGPDPDHQSRHLRVDTAIPTNDHVDQAPYVVRLKISNRGPNQTRDGDQGRVHRLADQHPTASETPPPAVPGLRRQQVRHGHLHDS
jgi:hypothetical protein